jgi:hypothetical protein
VEHPKSGIEDRLLVAPDELLEGTSVALAAAPHQRLIILLFHKYWLPGKRLIGRFTPDC